MMRKTDFMEWLSEFFDKKSNELEYSQRMQPKRMQKVTYDLSTAPTRPVELNVPFASLIVSRIYSTATPATDKAGTFKVMFDTDDDANIQNAIALFPNDSLRLGVACRKAFFTWSAQSDTSVDFYVFPDIEVIAGTTKTQIVGTVTTSGAVTNSSSSWKYPLPSAIASLQQAGAGTTSYTVPVGKYAWVSAMTYVNTAATTAYATIDGITLCNGGTGANNTLTSARVLAKAGQVISCVVGGGGAGNISSAQIEVYDV